MSVKKILRAMFVLPFTAGSIKTRRNGDFSSHDASISGVILLSAAVVILAVLMVMLGSNSSAHRILMIVLLFIGILCLIVCSAILYVRRDWAEEKNTNTIPSEGLKLKFLWLFCIVNSSFQALKVAKLAICDSKSELGETAVYFACTWVFHVIQTIFIQKYSRFKLYNNVCLYYCLFFVFIANISLWVHRTVDLYYEDFANFVANYSKCSCENNNGSEIARVVEDTQPFLDPILLEYCLLSVILISKMWPAMETTNVINELNSSTTPSENTDEASILLQRSTTEQSCVPCRRRSFIVVTLLTLIYIVVMCTLQRLPLYRHVPNAFTTMTNLVYISGNCVHCALLFKCFYSLSFELRPKTKIIKVFNLKARINVITSVATCGFHVTQVYYIHFNNNNEYAVFLALTIFRVMVVVVQTIFMVQMKLYRKSLRFRTNSVTSIDSTFLFICLMNFGLWFGYTFLTIEKELRSHEHAYNYDVLMMLKLIHFVMPFMIFYHFESFISFYHFFNPGTNS